MNCKINYYWLAFIQKNSNAITEKDFNAVTEWISMKTFSENHKKWWGLLIEAIEEYKKEFPNDFS